MPATVVYPQSPVGPYTVTPVSAGDLNLSWQAADTVNGNYFSFDIDDGDIILVWNTDTASPPEPHHFTLTSVPDTPFERTGDITNYVVNGGEIAAYNLGGDTAYEGWGTLVNGAYQIKFLADSDLILFAILTR